MISKSTSFVSLGFSSSLFWFFPIVQHCVLFMPLYLEVLGTWFSCSKTEFQFGVCLLFRPWCADGQCLLQAKPGGRAMSFFSLGNLPKAAIIPQFVLLELFHLYRFAKHMVKIKLLIFPWGFPGGREAWLLQEKPWSESFLFLLSLWLSFFSLLCGI